MSNPADLPYRPCVGIMLLNGAGHVFVGQRLDMKEPAWQMPQGGIDPGETPRAAALRELEEEVGTNNAEIIGERSDWLNYDLPDRLLGTAWNGKYRGQTQRWFAMRFAGKDSDINIETEHPEFGVWRWLPMSDLVASIVPFKRAIYQQVVDGFRHLAE